MSDDMTFGERLQAARFVSGVTQAELARRIGRDPRIVTAWEQERHKPAQITDEERENIIATANLQTAEKMAGLEAEITRLWQRQM